MLYTCCEKFRAHYKSEVLLKIVSKKFDSLNSQHRMFPWHKLFIITLLKVQNLYVHIK